MGATLDLDTVQRRIADLDNEIESTRDVLTQLDLRQERIDMRELRDRLADSISSHEAAQ